VMVVLVATALTFEWLRDPPIDSSVPPTGTSLA
jgi:hypothetical protein